MRLSPFTSFNTNDFMVVITCADGLENALLIELEGFGLMGAVLRTGRVRVSLGLAQFYHLCLYSKVASRILLPIGEYHFCQKVQTLNQIREQNGKKITRTLEHKVIDEDIPSALYEFASRYEWSDIFGVDKTFAIRLSVDKRVAVNQQFATLRIKDAIADCFNDKLGKRPSVDKSPNVCIYAHISPELCELYLDLSGLSLHKRGYRVMNTDAPLKENLAAALLYECGWHEGKHSAIIDPMCGSGTFITEALLMKTAYPVGIDKKVSEFGFYHWQYHDEALWQTLTSRALQAFYDNLSALEQELVSGKFNVIALDASDLAIEACQKNIKASALMPISHAITPKHMMLSHAKTVLKNLQSPRPLIITNPPYGERLGDGDVIKPLYQGLGLIVADALSHLGRADMAVLASHIEHADTLPLTDPKTLKCHNGALTVYFRHGAVDFDKTNHKQYDLLANFTKKDIHNPDSQEFINRLHKNLSHLKKHAIKDNISNMRIYDADLPNFNVAIDVYGDKIHVQEYAPPKHISTDVAKERFNLILSAIRQIFGINRESLFIKTRMRQSGNDQYAKNTPDDKKKKLWVVKEHGAYFYVNFSDYLDTGLFIDHRNIRQMIKQASFNKKVLNLFAYTCTASIHSALGGAMSVTSVDLSANYLNWGKQNFALNGLDLSAKEGEQLKYQFIAGDVFEWLKDHTQKYDVIFIDPPTFSNSKKFKGTFDVQRDHVALINRAMNRLTADGVLYFSNNFTKFVLDESLKERYEVMDITHQTIGVDFNLKKPIHQSFKICHKNSLVKNATINPDTVSKKPVKAFKDFQSKTPKKAKSQNLKQSFGKTHTQKPAFDGMNNQRQVSHDKPSQKIRYDKIDGKMVATVIDNPSDNPKDTLPKRFFVKTKINE